MGSIQTVQTLHQARNTGLGLTQNRFSESANVLGRLPVNKTHLRVKGKLEPVSWEQSKKQNVSIPFPLLLTTQSWKRLAWERMFCVSRVSMKWLQASLSSSLIQPNI
ncbi:hypothetical protein DF277_15685 [Listeria monocytogenes]|nr:hypothetical protein DF277_15685 [Listeria monocytogenes]